MGSPATMGATANRPSRSSKSSKNCSSMSTEAGSSLNLNMSSVKRAPAEMSSAATSTLMGLPAASRPELALLRYMTAITEARAAAVPASSKNRRFTSSLARIEPLFMLERPLPLPFSLPLAGAEVGSGASAWKARPVVSGAGSAAATTDSASGADWPRSLSLRFMGFPPVGGGA
ncbi:hypothetical protein D3C72_848800 [compost metagenome]